jgi:RAB protein geranylgeranyltransferase component A
MRLFSEPEHFEYLFEGTDLETTLLSAAIAFKSSSPSKKILHVDPNGFYGSQDGTFYPSQHPKTTSNAIPEAADRKFFLDARPRVFLAADAALAALARAGCGEFLTFTPVEIFFRFSAGEEFAALPTSKAAVFGDRKFSLAEKRNFMKFVTAVGNSLAFNSPDKIPDVRGEEGTSDWREFMEKQGLSERQIAMIDACICFSETRETKEGLGKIRKFLDSLGKFSEHALLYPNFGTSEILQAFARKAAVHGALFALNAGISDQAGNSVRLTTGDELEVETVVRASRNPASIDGFLAIVYKDETHAGSCQLKIDRNSWALVLGAHTQCCPEGFVLVYGAEKLVSEISADKHVVFRAEIESDGKLLFDEHDLDRVKRKFAEFDLGAFPF